MLKWIKNSKSSKTNKTSKYRGVTINYNKYEASVLLTKYNKEGKRKQTRYVIGNFRTEIEAKDARVKFILEML